MNLLKDMTLEELKALKTAWYETADKDGTLLLLADIARKLGEKVNTTYGPKYRFTEDNIEIYVDDYGHYMTIYIDSKLKVSTHNEKLYVKGDWENNIPRWNADRQASESKAISDAIEKERLELIQLLS